MGSGGSARKSNVADGDSVPVVPTPVESALPHTSVRGESIGGKGRKRTVAAMLHPPRVSMYVPEDDSTLDVFLCGMTGSGKSTMTRQLLLRWGDRQGLHEDEKRYMIFSIRKNMVDWVNKSIQAMQTEDLEPHSSANATCARYSLIDLEDIEALWWEIALGEKESEFDKGFWENIARIITTLEAVRPFNKAAPLINDSAASLLHTSLRKYMVKGKIDVRIFQESFELDFEDVVYTMAPTKEYDMKTFIHNERQFRLCDVSGQRHHTQSWQLWRSKRTCAIIYVMNLMDYILTDAQGCRLATSIEIFKEFLMTLAKPTKVVLVMNKFDLFKEQLTLQQLTECPSFSENEEAIRREDESDHMYATRCKHLVSRVFVSAFDKILIKKDWNLTAHQRNNLISYHSSCAIDRCFVQTAMDHVMNDIAEHQKKTKMEEVRRQMSKPRSKQRVLSDWR